MRTRKLTLVVFIILLLGACGASAKQKTLKNTLAGLNAARDGFLTYDEVRQREIVADAKTYVGGQEALREYREDQRKIVIAFEAAYKILAMAALDMSDVNIAAALLRAADVYNLIRELIGEDDAAGIVPTKPD